MWVYFFSCECNKQVDCSAGRNCVQCEVHKSRNAQLLYVCSPSFAARNHFKCIMLQLVVCYFRTLFLFQASEKNVSRNVQTL